MFKCLHQDSGAEIIILQPEWHGRLDVLRLMDRGDELVCQGCRQPVRVRRGSARRRAHFAHKHLKGCLYGSQSPEILAARAALFDWLSAQYPGRVDLERAAPGADLPRPLDCWVDTPQGPFACWIIEGSLKLAARERIQAGFQMVGAPVTTVLLARLLHPDPNHPNRLLLSPTERAFLRHTPFDSLGREGYVYSADFGRSLHYLDAAEGVLTTWRGLEKVHEPQGYAGRRLVTRLERVRAGGEGEWFHPGEAEQLASQPHIDLQQAQREAARRQRKERLQHWRSLKQPPQTTAPSEAVCVHCGQITSDYWMNWMEENRRLCKCRECLARGLA